MNQNKRRRFSAAAMLLCLIPLLLSQNKAIDEKMVREVEDWENQISAERQPPEVVLDLMGVEPGMVIGEVGAGRGRFTVHLARRVGESGKIYANDISETALDYLRFRCQKNDIRNVEIIMGEEEDPLLPEKSLDMIIMIWVFHMLNEPVPLMKNMLPSLKPDAPLIILAPPDYEIDEEIETMKGRLPAQRLTIRQRIEKAAVGSGFELVRTDDSLPKDTFFFLKAKSQ